MIKPRYRKLEPANRAKSILDPATALPVCVLVISIQLFAPAGLSKPAESGSVASSSNLHRWGAVTLFHGLPSDHVRAISQDPNGIMWFGTDGGLVKYDGRRIQRPANDGPGAARVLALRIDREGVLWIGGDAGAARLINGEIKPVPETHDSAVTAIITPETGHVMMTSEQGEIFDCTIAPDGSLSVEQINPDDHPLLTIESRGHTPLRLTSLALIDSKLLVGTRSRGLLSIDTTQIKAGAMGNPDLVKEILSRPRAFFVEAIETDARERVWFGAGTAAGDSGFYDGGDLMRPEKIGAATGPVTAIKADARGNIWVGTDARGVFAFREGRMLDQFTFENTGGGLLSNHIYSIFIDREGVAWFGTDRGVCRYDPHALQVETISADAESNFARTLFQSSEGTLWCGTNRGLFLRDKSSNWQEVKELKGKIIHSLAEDSQGRLLVGTASGLFSATRTSRPKRDSSSGREFSRIDNASGTSDNIRAITTFRGAVYLANFGSGVERLEGSRRTLVWPEDSAGAGERQVVSLHSDNERLWIGTAETGVFLFDGRKTTVDHELDELSGAAVRSIEGTTDELLWLASARGLYALKSGKLLKVIEGVDARSIVAPSGGQAERSIWCATVGGGLYKVLLDDDGERGDAAASFIHSRLDSEQGMPSQNAFAVVAARNASGDEVLWIGTNRGVACYEPAREAPVLNVTRAMAKRVYTSEELQAGLNLEYPQNSLALDVAAISSRTFPEQFQYSFAVLNSDNRVVHRKRSRESQLLIEGIRPGDYRVVARAFTKDLVPSDALQFSFSVARAPFPWTSTALSVLLALALLAVWWGYRQNRRLFGANRQLADTRMQLANETETERRRIARDLHDQTLADLRRLMMLTDQLPVTERKNGHLEPSSFRDEIETVSTEIRRICEDLSPSALANVGLAAALEWAIADAVAHQPAERQFEYEFICDGGIEERVRLEPAVQIQIYRIVQEGLSNICRHSSATRVRLAVAIDTKDELLIELEDNGCGFDSTRQGKIARGLANIRSRASLIDARVSWSARPDGGTVFTLRKPVEFVVR
jgi:signal transduction histidine kinase